MEIYYPGQNKIVTGQNFPNLSMSTPPQKSFNFEFNQIS